MCIEIVDKNEEELIYGRFWNLGQVTPFPMEATVHFKMLKEDPWEYQNGDKPERGGIWKQLTTTAH